MFGLALIIYVGHRCRCAESATWRAMSRMGGSASRAVCGKLTFSVDDVALWERITEREKRGTPRHTSLPPSAAAFGCDPPERRQRGLGCFGYNSNTGARQHTPDQGSQQIYPSHG